MAKWAIFTREYFEQLDHGQLLSWWLFYSLNEDVMTPELIETALNEFGAVPRETILNLLAAKRYRRSD